MVLLYRFRPLITFRMVKNSYLVPSVAQMGLNRGKMGKNIAKKKRPYGSGPHYVELFVGPSFGLRPLPAKLPDCCCIQ